MDPFDVYVLQVVARGGLMISSQITSQYVRDNAQELFGPRRNLRATLSRLRLKGWLETRDVTYAAANARPGDATDSATKAGRVVFDKAYYVTRRASLELNVPLPPNIRENFVEHHIQTMNALQKIEERYRDQGCEVVGFKTESQLIKESFAGKTFDATYRTRVVSPSGKVTPKYADAVLTVRHPDGRTEDVSVEYVSSKYTNKQIQEKHRAFSGPVIWACNNSETAGRVAELTGEEPLLV